jgi:hypothetical protein
MNPRLTFRRVSWKWSLPGLMLVALLTEGIEQSVAMERLERASVFVRTNGSP